MIIADEPTSALDVVVQRQVMETLGQVQEGSARRSILIGHDMGLIAQFVDPIGVMYAGKLVEYGPIDDVLDKPQHPYTHLLIESLPSLERKASLRGIPGLPPSLLDLPPGLPVRAALPHAFDRCPVETPLLREVGARPSASPAICTRGGAAVRMPALATSRRTSSGSWRRSVAADG